MEQSSSLLLACFFFSGAAGLIYEVVWARSLVLIFGATVLAVSTVLATFMGGLALGSFVLGRYGDRHPSPLRLYGLLEAGIGLYALLVPAVFYAVERAYIGFYRAFDPSFTVLSLFRLVLCITALILPTTLMGGTLPVLSRYFVRSKAKIGAGIGVLYALNTFGAVVGAFSTGFVLIPTIGLRSSTLLAAGINLLVAAVSLRLAAKTPSISEEEKSETAAPADEAQPKRTPAASESTIIPSVLLLAFGVSGFAAMAYEVAWTRGLEVVFGGSAYAFSTMLTAFLLGLAIGGAVGARLADRLKQPERAFVILELIIAATALAVVPVMGRMPLWLLWVFQKMGPGFAPFQTAVAAGCILVMLAPTLCMGAIFPIVGRIYATSLKSISSKVGYLYAANTAGTILGSLIAGFVFIPTIGPERTIGIAASANVVAAGIVLTTMRLGTTIPSAFQPVSALVGMAILVSAALMPRWDPRITASGLYVYGHELLQGSQFRRNPIAGLKLNRILYYKDGLTASVVVRRLQDEKRVATSLAINGKTDASNMDLSTQLLLAHLPMLLREKPVKGNVLVIGLGSGCTAGAVLRYPVRSVDCVEIEPAVVEASRFFTDINRSYWKDPRLNLIIGDGRNHVMMTPKRYECIISEPSNPWISGVSNLFTREHYQRIRDRLAPDGIFCQWIPAYHMSIRDLKMAVGTLTDVFPHTSLWTYPPIYTDIFLIASMKPLRLNPRELARRAASPTTMPDLEKINIRGLWGILQGFVMGGRDLVAYSFGADRHTDDLPLLEFSAAKSVRLDVGEASVDNLFGRRNHLLPLDIQTNPNTLNLLGLEIAAKPNWQILDTSLSNRHWRVNRPKLGSYLMVRMRPRVVLRIGRVEAELLCTYAPQPLPWREEIKEAMGPSAVPMPTSSGLGHPAGGYCSENSGLARGGVAWYCGDLGQQYLAKFSAHGGSVEDVKKAWLELESALKCKHRYP
ncbi:MAG: fused MFS/spermidine synthase [Armatimonadota bacterium]